MSEWINHRGERINPHERAEAHPKTKPQRIQRPFHLRQAAQDCAELATKAGWLRVTVEELVET